jgi:histone deacetylase 1/2
MQEELQALHSNQTWTLVPPHPTMNVIGSRWVYKIKRHANGQVAQYKARLVARDFTQQEGIDYLETFSPVIKPTTVHLVLTIAISYGWTIHQLDVHNAFLNGILQEEVYMAQPPRFVDPALPSHVCRLHKSLYSLKQAPRAWYNRLSEFLLSIGFQASKGDTSLFILSYDGAMIYLLVYVDDILLTGSNSVVLHRLITLLQSEFKLWDLGSVHFFLGIEVKSTAMGILLSQHKYALDIIQRAGMTSCKPVDTPLSASSKLALIPGTLYSDPTRYRQIVGALQYLTFTRPNICYAVNKVCQFMHAPTEDHWSAVKRILRYLQATTTYGLHITRDSPLSLHGFTDADWAGSIDDRKSIGGYLVYLGSTPISWKSGKQRTVARSSTEAEYKALADGTAEILWIRSLLTKLRVPSSTVTTLWCDNLGPLSYLQI